MKSLKRKLGAICCGHVFRRERDILFVATTPREWQFMCGQSDHYSSRDGHFVLVGVLVDFDPSLDELADLPIGWEAERSSVGSPWIVTKSNHSNT